MHKRYYDAIKVVNAVKAHLAQWPSPLCHDLWQAFNYGRATARGDWNMRRVILGGF